MPESVNLPELALLQRYDKLGPRYTSYPTALQFHSNFNEQSYRALIASQSSSASTTPLSLYIHVPFCASPCYFCGCTKVITRQVAVADRYVEHLLKDIERRSALLPRTRPVQQLHFGGGTPTYLCIDQLAMVMNHIDRHFNVSSLPKREFSIEVDPRTVTAKMLPLLSSIGLNRISLGVQDFDPRVQNAVNRVQSAAQTLNLIETAKHSGFKSVSVDIIYGLPLQTLTSFEQTLDLLLATRPDRIAAYSYAHLPQRFKAQRQIQSDQLPTPDEKFALLKLTVERLLNAGYVYIGMDHFALPDDELVEAAAIGTLQRNFQGYSTHGGTDLIGVGMSAISRVGNAYAQNMRTLPAYSTAVDMGALAIERGIELSGDDLVRRDVIEALMCRCEVRFAEISARHDLDFESHFSKELSELQSLADDGLVTLEAGRILVTAKGRYLLRAVAMIFDAYLNNHRERLTTSPSYSRVI